MDGISVDQMTKSQPVYICEFVSKSVRIRSSGHLYIIYSTYKFIYTHIHTHYIHILLFSACECTSYIKQKL